MPHLSGGCAVTVGAEARDVERSPVDADEVCRKGQLVCFFYNLSSHGYMDDVQIPL